MSETNGGSNGINSTSDFQTMVAEKVAANEPIMKKPKLDESVEERDFDEATQKALEEIDANQNEIDALNERKSIDLLDRTPGEKETERALNSYVKKTQQHFVVKLIYSNFQLFLLEGSLKSKP